MTTVLAPGRFVTGDGAALHVTQSGPADSAVTLVLVHGWTQDHRTWDFVLPHLDPGLRVLRYDLRGHGGSAPARPGSATIARLADDLAELIAGRVPAGPLVLAGHSMGGMTLMVLAERHPALVRDRLAGAAFVATSSGDMDRLTLGFPGVVGRSVTRFEPRVARLLARLRSETLRLRPGMVRSVARGLIFGDRPGRAQVDSVVEQLLCAHPASAGLVPGRDRGPPRRRRAGRAVRRPGGGPGGGEGPALPAGPREGDRGRTAARGVRPVSGRRAHAPPRTPLRSGPPPLRPGPPRHPLTGWPKASEGHHHSI
jgi:pimeloyl-ACP methyl ester carboxylesterase